MKELTKNDRVKNLVRTVVLDEDYEALQIASKNVEVTLNQDPQYIKLVKSVEAYRLSKYAESKKYQDISRAVLFTAFRAASKMLPFIKFPADYLDDEKKREELAKSGIYNTDARLASVILKVNDTFKDVKKRRKENRVPLTEDEIRQLRTLVESGLIDPERAEAQIKAGKIKR